VLLWSSTSLLMARAHGRRGSTTNWTESFGDDTLVFLHAIDDFVRSASAAHSDERRLLQSHALRDELWKELPGGDPYAVGVVLFGLVPDSMHVPSLFDDLKMNKLTKTLDAVNARFGKEAIHFGATHDTMKLAPLRIAFSRIPDESEI
jgi:hypothetical protein